MKDIDVGIALVAGLLSFLSPCVLPLIPSYLSFISGYGLADIRAGKDRGRIITTTLAFVLGFTIVFVVLGLLFAGGGAALGAIGGGTGLLRRGPSLSRILAITAGCIVILLGGNLVFDFAKFLSFEKRVLPSRTPRGYAGALFFGMAFGAGWSPCIGPILASILLVAARAGEASRALLLLGGYSLGLALPFVAVGLFFDRLEPLLAFFKRRAKVVRIVSGVLLMAIGTAMALGRLAIFNSFAFRGGYALKDLIAAVPSLVRYIAAAAWSFLALVVLAIQLARGRGLLRPVPLALLGLFVALLVAELSGLISTPSLIVNWLLFQGF
jgi:cytochrome c-type biogenesis protein